MGTIQVRLKSRAAVFAEATRYLIASALALGIDFLVYSVLIRLFGVNYLIAATAGFSLGLIAIYLLSIKLVFHDRTMPNQVAEFVSFAGIGIAGLLLTMLILYILVDRLRQNYEVSKMISAGLVFGFNFTLRKLMLFNKKDQ